MTIQDILAAKGNMVYQIGPDATLADVARELVQHRVGSLVVCQPHSPEGTRFVGIITERDILYCCARGDTDLSKIRVADVMSTNLFTGLPDDAIENVMGLMTTRRIRHLPVVAEGRLLGIISIGDVVKAQHDHLAMENRFMKDYIRS
jgi:CBS domain-containing protein